MQMKLQIIQASLYLLIMELFLMVEIFLMVELFLMAPSILSRRQVFADLNVVDALGETKWSYANDYPGLYVSWDANTEEDLAPVPYEVFVSGSNPSAIEDMEKVKSTSAVLHQLDREII